MRPALPRGADGCRQGQSALEYAISLAVVVAALLGAQFYVKRAIDGRLRRVGESPGFLYVPRMTEADQTLTLTRTQTDTFSTIPNPGRRREQVTKILSDSRDETLHRGRQTVDETPAARLFD